LWVGVGGCGCLWVWVGVCGCECIAKQRKAKQGIAEQKQP